MWIVHSVQRKRHLVQIALRHNARRVDELLELRASLHHGLVEVCRQTQRLQVGIYDRVRLRQQPRHLRRSLLPQINRHCQRNNQRKHQ